MPYRAVLFAGACLDIHSGPNQSVTGAIVQALTDGGRQARADGLRTPLGDVVPEQAGYIND